MRVVVVGQRAGNVIVRELLSVGDGNEVESGFRFELDEQVVWLATGGDDRRDLARFHFLERNRVVDVDKLRANAQSFEYDRARGCGAPTFRTQADLLALQVLDRRYFRPGENIELAQQQFGDVVDPVLNVSDQ